ncbi:MAG TPA: hypothetical protein VMH32_22550 [Burkholderiales bacterium]|nr:hypothetical protein [Burkholderiales bacterium]
MKSVMSLSRRFVSALIMSIALSMPALADDTEGTWRLVMRKLPDGTVQIPPTVYGMGTTKNGIYQLIVFWPTPEGKPASLSSLSEWQWSEREVAVTPLLVIFDDGSGKPPVYTVGGETKRAPVTRQGARVSYQHPIDPPFVVREGDKATATLEGVFTDYWERVR